MTHLELIVDLIEKWDAKVTELETQLEAHILACDNGSIIMTMGQIKGIRSCVISVVNVICAMHQPQNSGEPQI